MDHLNITENELLNKTLDHQTDYFSVLYENRMSKWVFVSVAISLLPINILLLYSVTWYDVKAINMIIYSFLKLSVTQRIYRSPFCLCNTKKTKKTNKKVKIKMK